MCEFCQNHEQGDTLYEPSDWDGGIGFDYIRDIKYCPLCGKKLNSEDESTISKMEQVDEPQTMLNDGTLVINVEDATKVSRVLVGDDKNRGDLYYPDDEDEPQTEEHCENCRHKDECEGATYEYKNTEWWCLAYAPIDEPQTDCAWGKCK